MTYLVDFGTDLSNSAYSSSPFFNSHAAFLTNILQPSTAKNKDCMKKHAFKITILLKGSTCFSSVLISSLHKSAIVLIPMGHVLKARF